jgi:H+/gluconate symporter-like permease
MNTKPKLVDPNWFAKPKPKPIKKVIPTNIDNSLIINIIGLCILLIGGLCIYQRYLDREKTELETKHKIIELNEYVKRNIK